MQREGLVQPFRQTAGRRLVPVLQLAMECLERRAGLVVLGTVAGALEALAPGGLLLLGQVTDHVFARGPLAPVDQGPVPEGLPNGRPEPLPAVEDHQRALGDIEAALDQRPQKRGQHPLVLCVRFDKAQKAFLPRIA